MHDIYSLLVSHQCRGVINNEMDHVLECSEAFSAINNSGNKQKLVPEHEHEKMVPIY